MEKFESHEPVKYWILDKRGYPLQIRINIEGELENAVPILKGETTKEIIHKLGMLQGKD